VRTDTCFEAAAASNAARNTGAVLIGAKEAGKEVVQEVAQDASKTVQRILDPYGRLADVQNETGSKMVELIYQTIKDLQSRLRAMKAEYERSCCK